KNPVSGCAITFARGTKVNLPLPPFPSSSEKNPAPPTRGSTIWCDGRICEPLPAHDHAASQASTRGTVRIGLGVVGPLVDDDGGPFLGEDRVLARQGRELEHDLAAERTVGGELVVVALAVAGVRTVLVDAVHHAGGVEVPACCPGRFLLA